jgi:hypothetical protein
MKTRTSLDATAHAPADQPAVDEQGEAPATANRNEPAAAQPLQRRRNQARPPEQGLDEVEKHAGTDPAAYAARPQQRS